MKIYVLEHWEEDSLGWEYVASFVDAPSEAQIVDNLLWRSESLSNGDYARLIDGEEVISCHEQYGTKYRINVIRPVMGEA